MNGAQAPFFIGIAHDQRIVLAGLTKAGVLCFESMSKRMRESYLHLEVSLGEEKLDQLMELLDDLKQLQR